MQFLSVYLLESDGRGLEYEKWKYVSYHVVWATFASSPRPPAMAPRR